jgi:hypothetical protein
VRSSATPGSEASSAAPERSTSFDTHDCATASRAQRGRQDIVGEGSKRTTRPWPSRAAFWGLGLGGLRRATLPKWFTVVLGVVGVLGPLAMIVYLLLPLWLIAASVVTASREAAREPQPTGV